MKIIISNSSSVPIYEQIKNTIINQIMQIYVSTFIRSSKKSYCS